MRALLTHVRGALRGADVVAIPLAVLSIGLVFVNLLLRGVGVEPYITLFSVTVEANVPTWFSAGLLLVAGVAAVAAGWLTPPEATALRRSWFVFAAVLAALSLDDTASLHERLGAVGDDVVQGQSAGGLLHFAWVVPGFLAAAVVVAGMVQLARQVPRRVRRQLIFGTALFFSGALGAEMLSGVVLDTVGDGLAYALVTAVEELLEMLGVVVILRGTLQVMSVRRTAPAAVSVRYVGAATPVRRSHAHPVVPLLPAQAAPRTDTTSRAAPTGSAHTS